MFVCLLQNVFLLLLYLQACNKFMSAENPTSPCQKHVTLMSMSSAWCLLKKNCKSVSGNCHWKLKPDKEHDDIQCNPTNRWFLSGFPTEIGENFRKSISCYQIKNVRIRFYGTRRGSKNLLKGGVLEDTSNISCFSRIFLCSFGKRCQS